ncbi:hypothetical protein ColLi_12710 [Colletotrichum liriopes]|uniref:Uncharacterized protein n=1 Tax=Colletotrichum liriopes TaxID=708192 RepID=A0AA37GZF0_9PEZI|nr:hypothetical protein ColLi_12710 [Colletotrichum liriopes]
MKTIRMQVSGAAAEAEADDAHEEFTMVRFSLRVPIASAILDEHDQEGSEHGGSTWTARLQMFELCFHRSFYPDHTRPISLHFDSVGPDSVLQSAAPSILRTPSPPSCVYEIPEVLDLTAPSPSPSSSPPPAELEITPASNQTPHSLRRRRLAILPTILFLRTSLAEALLRRLDALDAGAPDLLSNLSVTIRAVCVNTTVLMALETGTGLPGPEAALGLVCETLRQRAQHAQRLWSGLRHRLVEGWLVARSRSLRLAAWAARNLQQDDKDLIGLYRRLVLDDDADRWMPSSCDLCNREIVGSDGHGSDEQPVWDWHFACDTLLGPSPSSSLLTFPSIPAVLNAEAISANLSAWAARQSARRSALINDPLIDVDGEPLFPGNKHPVFEADDVTDPMLPGEGDVMALTRHMAELREALRQLSTLLVGTVAGIEPGDVAGDTSTTSTSATPTPPAARPWLWDWFPGGGGGDVPDHERRRRDIETSVRDSVAHLLTFGETHLDPLLRDLGQASAGLALICIATEGFRRHLAALEHGLAWTSLAEETATTHSGTDTTPTIKLIHTRYTSAPLDEAAAMEREIELVAAAIERVQSRPTHRRERSPTMPASSPSPRPPSSPEAEEEAWEFVRGAKRSLHNPHLEDLAQILNVADQRRRREDDEDLDGM